jgi:rhodanese-related sulfurtransferase
MPQNSQNSQLDSSARLNPFALLSEDLQQADEDNADTIHVASNLNPTPESRSEERFNGRAKVYVIRQTKQRQGREDEMVIEAGSTNGAWINGGISGREGAGGSVTRRSRGTNARGRGRLPRNI